MVQLLDRISYIMTKTLGIYYHLSLIQNVIILLVVVQNYWIIASSNKNKMLHNLWEMWEFSKCKYYAVGDLTIMQH